MVSMKKFQKLSKEKFVTFVTVMLVTMFFKVHVKAKMKTPLPSLF